MALEISPDEILNVIVKPGVSNNECNLGGNSEKMAVHFIQFIGMVFIPFSPNIKVYSKVV